jgi:hypothetical protein
MITIMGPLLLLPVAVVAAAASRALSAVLAIAARPLILLGLHLPIT